MNPGSEPPFSSTGEYGTYREFTYEDDLTSGELSCLSYVQLRCYGPGHGSCLIHEFYKNNLVIQLLMQVLII